MPKKILILAESIDQNSTSGAKARYALVKNLQSLGHIITVFHASGKTIEIPHVNSIFLKEPTFTLYYLLSRLQRALYRFCKLKLSEAVEKICGQSFTFYNDSLRFQQGLKTQRPTDYDMIWTLSQGNNYRAHHAVLQKPEWHSKWFAYVHDPYPQQLYPRPYNFVPSGYKHKRNFFRKITEKSFRVVFPSLTLKEWMQSYYVDIAEKSIIVPHQITNFDKKVSHPNYFNPKLFNILHAGNLLDLRDPSTLLSAYLKFLEDNPEAKSNSKLLVIGNTGKFTNEIKAIMEINPNIYSSLGYENYEVTRKMQQDASINIILEAKSEISPFLPGKFPHCVAADKPIVLIGPYYSESKRLLGEDYLYSHNFTDIEKIAESFSKLYLQWKKNPEGFNLNRSDLDYYLGMEYLSEVLNKV
ncbi:MAG: UDP-glycosyltransferase [Croceibacter sp.]|nr:UDP-glycosyltransferase [Croceibacter sp.]